MNLLLYIKTILSFACVCIRFHCWCDHSRNTAGGLCFHSSRLACASHYSHHHSSVISTLLRLSLPTNFLDLQLINLLLYSTVEFLGKFKKLVLDCCIVNCPMPLSQSWMSRMTRLWPRVRLMGSLVEMLYDPGAKKCSVSEWWSKFEHQTNAPNALRTYYWAQNLITSEWRVHSSN